MHGFEEGVVPNYCYGKIIELHCNPETLFNVLEKVKSFGIKFTVNLFDQYFFV